MRRTILAALLLACALVLTPFALASGGDSTAPVSEPAVVPAAPPCTSIGQVYSWKNWQDAHPAQGVNVCPAGSSNGSRKIVEHFYEYRRYRQIATMRCLSGKEGWFVPNPGSCSTLQCESGLSWGSKNTSSGAEWAYQLLGGHTYPTNGFFRRLRGRTIDGGPEPNTFAHRLINHEIASTLGRSSWTC